MELKKIVFLTVLLFAAPLFGFQSVVFLPFSNDSETQQIYWLGEGFSESLTEEMLLKNVYVIQRPERMAAYDALKLPYVGHLSRATMLKIGDQLAANYIVFGSYKLVQKNLTVEAQVIRTSSSKLSSPIRASGSLDRLYDVQRNLINGLQQYFASEKLTPEPNRIELSSVPLHAYELYIKGLLEPTNEGKVDFFRRAMEAYSGYAQAIYRLGVAQFRLGHYKESNEALAKITDDGLFRTRTDFLMGLNAFFLRDYQTSTQKWYELTKTNPTPELYNNIGIALIRRNELDNAIAYLSKAVELDPEHSDFRFNLAACYAQKEANDDAIREFRQAINLRPNDYQALYWLGRTLEHVGKPQSKQVLAFYLDRLPGDQKGKFPDQYPTVTTALRASYVYLTKEEKEYSRIARASMMKQRSEYVRTYQGNADKQLQDDHPDLAIQEIKKGLTLAPFDSYLNYLWGVALLRQQNRTAAAAQLEFSLWCTDNVDSHLLLAQMYRESEQMKEAKDHLQHVLSLDPKNKKALDMMEQIGDRK
jgi:tetratricopeptide (TPR) repeat protein